MLKTQCNMNPSNTAVISSLPSANSWDGLCIAVLYLVPRLVLVVLFAFSEIMYWKNVVASLY